ncbi:alpha-N-acetylgalactosaminide alpha-2,6-sialyltransferase 5-like [Strongylocentrotus purpuratus]|uniref:Uncharacterized protein n=1 Tax=Strongylocentrotus purpuratus TaxID=7668 RepID=A0A7M7HNM5_STRPU|nr:alpha-N-acetylgalactosaminide alpha-2,6-sialyltransferase 5-like [Strongylocentrotus purpuratus]
MQLAQQNYHTMANFTTFRQRICQRIMKLRDYALVLTSVYSIFMFFVVCYLLYRSPSKVESIEGGYPRSQFKSYSEDDKNDTGSGTEPPTRSPNTGYYFLDTNQTFTKRCRQCSLVSSAGHLYESGAGADIDSADCVIRMNTAPVTGWTEDVGARTDIRIIGHVNLPRGLVRKGPLRREILEDEDTRAKYVVVPWLYDEKINMTTQTTHIVVKTARDFKKKYPEVNFVFLTREKYEASEKRFKLETGFSRNEVNTWFSTGFVSMMFALDVCDKVHVYGLSTSEFCIHHPKSKVPYHYYEPEKMTECSFQKQNELGLARGHKFLTERAMFARWSLIYDITFHYPSWKATIENVTGNLDTPFLRKYKEALQSGKLGDIPHYVYKNGKRFRIIYKRRVRKVVVKAPQNGTSGIDEKAPKDEKSLPKIETQSSDQNHNDTDEKSLSKAESQVKGQNMTVNKDKDHAPPRKKKRVVRKVVRKKRDLTENH